MDEVINLTSLVQEQAQCREKATVLLHSPEILDALKDRKEARPLIITSAGITNRMRMFYASQGISFDRWDIKRAEYILEELRKTFPRYNGVTAERFYQIGRYMNEKDVPEQTDIFAGLLFNSGLEVFDCYLKLTCGLEKANTLSKLADSMQTFSDNKLWLRIAAPAAYAATRIPGLQILDSSGHAMKISPEVILETARQKGIDYEHFQTLS